MQTGWAVGWENLGGHSSQCESAGGNFWAATWMVPRLCHHVASLQMRRGCWLGDKNNRLEGFGKCLIISQTFVIYFELMMSLRIICFGWIGHLDRQAGRIFCHAGCTFCSSNSSIHGWYCVLRNKVFPKRAQLTVLRMGLITTCFHTSRSSPVAGSADFLHTGGWFRGLWLSMRTFEKCQKCLKHNILLLLLMLQKSPRPQDQPPFGCINPCKEWDKLPTSTGESPDFWTINSSHSLAWRSHWTAYPWFNFSSTAMCWS